MPIYEYLALGESGCPACREKFEVFQKISDAALTTCPECGGQVERVLSAPSIHGVGAGDQKISNKNLADKGFTKYVKAGDGHYEKAAGKGPNVIKR